MRREEKLNKGGVRVVFASKKEKPVKGEIPFYIEISPEYLEQITPASINENFRKECLKDIDPKKGLTYFSAGIWTGKDPSTNKDYATGSMGMGTASYHCPSMHFDLRTEVNTSALAQELNKLLKFFLKIREENN